MTESDDAARMAEIKLGDLVEVTEVWEGDEDPRHRVGDVVTVGKYGWYPPVEGDGSPVGFGLLGGAPAGGTWCKVRRVEPEKQEPKRPECAACGGEGSATYRYMCRSGGLLYLCRRCAVLHPSELGRTVRARQFQQRPEWSAENPIPVLPKGARTIHNDIAWEATEDIPIGRTKQPYTGQWRPDGHHVREHWMLPSQIDWASVNRIEAERSKSQQPATEPKREAEREEPKERKCSDCGATVPPFAPWDPSEEACAYCISRWQHPEEPSDSSGLTRHGEKHSLDSRIAEAQSSPPPDPAHPWESEVSTATGDWR